MQTWLRNIVEHYMVRRAIGRGVSKKCLTRPFNIHLSTISQRINLLEGVVPETSIRAKVEHQCQIIKRQFGYVKHRELTKNTANLMTLFSLINLRMIYKLIFSTTQELAQPKPNEGPATGAKSLLERYKKILISAMQINLCISENFSQPPLIRIR